MKINWNTRRADGLVISANSRASMQKLAEGIRQCKAADFDVRHCTKTSLDIEISTPAAPEHNFRVALIPKGAEKFKFHHQRETNVFDGTTAIRERFKLTKDQGLPELKEYLSLVLKNLVPGEEELTATIHLYKTPELEEKQ
jgi:hypothetical protein